MRDSLTLDMLLLDGFVLQAAYVRVVCFGSSRQYDSTAEPHGDGSQVFDVQ